MGRAPCTTSNAIHILVTLRGILSKINTCKHNMLFTDDCCQMSILSPFFLPKVFKVFLDTNMYKNHKNECRGVELLKTK